MRTIIHNDFIKSTSSSYISDIKRREVWQIDRLSIEENKLQGLISINNSSYIKQKVFHLSFFTALEFVSQIQIVFMHHHAKLIKKTEEVWMVESSFISRRKITKIQNLFVNMQATKIRIIRNYLYCWATHEILDDVGGLFEIKIKAVMKLPPT